MSRRVALLALLLIAAGCYVDAATLPGTKIIRFPMSTTGPKTLDPVRGASTYDNRACSQIYETLLQYKYFVRPDTLEPLLLAEMPGISEDGLQYTFRLKKGVHFHDDPCFEGGKGRELVADDVIYSWKRLADNSTHSQAWWLMKGTIVGFDEYRRIQNENAKKGGKFDYDVPVEGLEKLGRHEFRIRLTQPVTSLLYKLAMFQTSVVPREAVEHYGIRFSVHPVGTGPFVLKREEDWIRGKSIAFTRNPNYHECYFPEEMMDSDRERGWASDVGKRLPLVDRVEFTFFVESQPQFLEFLAGHLDYTVVPADNLSQMVVLRTKKLRSKWRKLGVQLHRVPQLDFIYRGFNMEDPIVGGYTPQKRALRQALHLATDFEEMNEAFYEGFNIIYDGPIPPGLDGHPEGHFLPQSLQGPDLDRAKKLLAQAGYPNGEGLPELEYWTNVSSLATEMVQMTQRQWRRIGVKLRPRLVEFAQLDEAMKKKKAQMFSLAWISDYPDGENNLALFYGPYESPDVNGFNYKNAEYDRLYEKIRTMTPSAERSRLYAKMRDMLIEDSPFIGSMARERFYVIRPWLQNFKPPDNFANWIKYLDVEAGERSRR